MLNVKEMIENLLNSMSSLKWLLKLNGSFQLAYAESIYDEILEERSHNGDGISQLANWFKNLKMELISGATIKRLCYQNSFYLLKNVRNDDLIHLYKKTKLQLTIITIKRQSTSFMMSHACFGQGIRQILMLLSPVGLGWRKLLPHVVRLQPEQQWKRHGLKLGQIFLSQKFRLGLSEFYAIFKRLYV